MMSLKFYKHLLMQNSRYLQIGNTSFSDSRRNGFDRCAHGVEEGRKFPRSFGFSALFQNKPGKGHHIGIKCTSVWHDERLLKLATFPGFLQFRARDNVLECSVDIWLSLKGEWDEFGQLQGRGWMEEWFFAHLVNGDQRLAKVRKVYHRFDPRSERI